MITCSSRQQDWSENVWAHSIAWRQRYLWDSLVSWVLSLLRVCVNQGPTPEGFLPKGGTSQVSGISGRSAPRCLGDVVSWLIWYGRSVEPGILLQSISVPSCFHSICKENTSVFSCFVEIWGPATPQETRTELGGKSRLGHNMLIMFCLVRRICHTLSYLLLAFQMIRTYSYWIILDHTGIIGSLSFYNTRRRGLLSLDLLSLLDPQGYRQGLLAMEPRLQQSLKRGQRTEDAFKNSGSWIRK